MKALLLAGAAALIAMTSQAAAGDWGGFYAGVQGGYGSGGSDFNNPKIGSGAPYDNSLDADGANGGLYAGYNWQTGNWVLGLDGGFSWSDISGEFVALDGADYDRFEATLEHFAIARAKIGYSFDNLLVFATGGVTSGQTEFTATYANSGGSSETLEKRLRSFTAGAGVEAKVSDHWSARAEYLYLGYDDKAFDIGEETTADFDAHIVRAGIAYHF